MNRMRRSLPVSAISLGLLICPCSAAPQSQQPQETTPEVRIEVNRVLVPVVVRDAQGHTVGNLTKEDFQVFDDDKPRPISGFTVEGRAAENAKAGGVNNPRSPAGQTASSPPHFVVFLFDDLHLNDEQLTRVKKAASDGLATALAQSGMADVVSVSGITNTGLTRDTAKLTAAIMSIQPHRIYQNNASTCGDLDYYQADLIENKNDGGALADAIQREIQCNPALQMVTGQGPTIPGAQNVPGPVDGGPGGSVALSLVQSAARRAMELGHRDTQATYALIAEFVRRMAKLPGQRTLVLVSPGFLSIEQDSQTTGLQIVELAAQSNVILSTIDARGLYSDQLEARDLSPGEGGPNLQYRSNELRMAADPMMELAYGTGGTFFHNNNDLNAGFRLLTEPPRDVYVLELSVNDVKADGSWHRLKVKVDREGMELQARPGYTMTRPAKTVPGPVQEAMAEKPADVPADVPAHTPLSQNQPIVPVRGLGSDRPTAVPTQEPADQRPAEPSNTTTLRVTSSLVFLDVTVLDRNGLPVTSGLTKDDFAIREEDRPQRIFSFEPPQAHTTTDTKGSELQAAPPRTVIVLDLLNSKFEDFSLIRNSAERYLEAQPSRLKSPTEMVVVGNESLDLIQSYTQNKEDLLFALRHLPPVLPYKMMSGSLGERFGQSLDALQQIALQNKGVPGRKNVIWLGTGGPNLDTSHLSDMAVEPIEEYVHATTNMLVNSRISLFVIYQGLAPQGLDTLSMIDASATIGDADPFAGDISFGTFVNETGGDIGGEIGRALQLGSEYYTLTYQPHGGAMDGKFRRIRVTVGNPNFRVVTKAGYFAPDKNAPVDPRQQIFTNMAEAARSVIPFRELDVQVSDVVQHPDSLTAGLTLHLKGQNLFWQDASDGKSTTRLHLATASLKANGDILSSKVQSVLWTAGTQDPARLAANETALQITIRVPRETRRVRVVVATEDGERIGAADLDRKTIDSAPSAPSPEPQLVRR